MPFEDEELILPDDAEPLRPESRGFAPDQLVACEECRRANPPTRMNCLYCGATLPIKNGFDDQRRPALRPLETWEQGFNVVLPPDPAALTLPECALAEAAEVLRTNAAQLREIIMAQELLPLARAASREESVLIKKRLGALGLYVEIIADEDLAVETQPPQRISTLDIEDDALTAWTLVNHAPINVVWPDVTLILTGRIFRKRIEIEERRSHRSSKEIVDTREFQEDQNVLDIYQRNPNTNLRIVADSFDYTCLAVRKSLLATENFARLIEALSTRATSASYVDAYRRVRHLLKVAWPLVEQTESGGLRRARPGKFNTEAVTSVSNETQFTRYGRLLNYFTTRDARTTE